MQPLSLLLYFLPVSEMHMCGCPTVSSDQKSSETLRAFQPAKSRWCTDCTLRASRAFVLCLGHFNNKLQKKGENLTTFSPKVWEWLFQSQKSLALQKSPSRLRHKLQNHRKIESKAAPSSFIVIFQCKLVKETQENCLPVHIWSFCFVASSPWSPLIWLSCCKCTTSYCQGESFV